MKKCEYATASQLWCALITCTRSGSTHVWFCCSCPNTNPKSFFTNLFRSAEELRECRRSSEGFRECRDTRKSHEEVRECVWLWREGTSFGGLDASEGARISARAGAVDVEASGSVEDCCDNVDCPYSWIGMSEKVKIEHQGRKTWILTYLAQEASNKTASLHIRSDPSPQSAANVLSAVKFHRTQLRGAKVEYHIASSQYLSFWNCEELWNAIGCNKKKTIYLK